MAGPLAARQFFSTGQIAHACGVSTRSVCKWIDDGLLQGFRLPCSKDRRVKAEDLVAFIRANGWPVPPELAEPVAIAFACSDLDAPPEVVRCADALDLGVALGRTDTLVARAVLGDDDGASRLPRAAELVRRLFPEALVGFAVSPDVCPSALAGLDPTGRLVLTRPVAWLSFEAVFAQLQAERSAIPRQGRHAARATG